MDQSPSDAFILGAGFSKAISDDMPVMAELADLVLQPDRWPGKSLPSGVGQAFGRDLELWLSYLTVEHAWLSDAENLRNHAEFLDASRIIADVLLERQEAALALACPGWLSSMAARWHNNRSDVITLNHDTLVEKAFVEQGQYPYRDHSLTYPIPPTNIALRTAGTWGGERQPTVRLMKLHGSVNWCFSGATSFYGETIYDLGMSAGWAGGDVASTYRERAPDKQPLIVPPTAAKTTFFENELIRANWRFAAEALRKATTLYCLGYSLPAADLPTRFLLRRGREKLKVVPVNVDPQAVCRRHVCLGTSVAVTATVIGAGCLS